MSKILKKVFILSLLILTAGVFCLVPNFMDETKAENLVAETVDQQTSDASSNLLLVDTKAATIETVSKYGHSSVYVIDSAEDLAFVSYQVNSGVVDYQKGVFSLEADIDLKGALWTPIGFSGKHFSGVFYGNGHSISNVNINDMSLAESGASAGLFGVTFDASICDLVLTGSYVITSSSTKGTLIGYMRGGEVINCYDESTKYGVTYSIGSANDGAHLFRGASVDGKVVKYTNEEDVNDAITVSSGAEITNSYVGFYNLSKGEFYQANTKWGKDVVGLLLDSYLKLDEDYTSPNNDANYLKNLPENKLYVTKAPVLRVEAVDSDIYPIVRGFTPSIPVISDMSFSNGLLLTIGMTYNGRSENFTFDYGYGNRKVVQYFDYDGTFADYFGSYKVEQTRVGYTFTGNIYEVDNNGTKIQKMNISSVPGKADYDYKKCFPEKGKTYLLEWTPIEQKQQMYYQFAIASNEGGQFTSLSSAISGFKLIKGDSVTKTTGSLSGNGYIIDVSGVSIGSGVNSQLEVTLNKGYQITGLGLNEIDVTVTGQKANQTSGIYTNFSYKTNADQNKTSASATESTYIDKSANYDENNIYWNDGIFETGGVQYNNDFHNPVKATGTAGVPNADGTTTYTINVENIVGPGGFVYIVIERTELKYDLMPTSSSIASDEINNYYTWTCDSSLEENVISEIEIDEITKIPYLVSKVGEKPTIKMQTNNEYAAIISMSTPKGIPSYELKQEVSALNTDYFRSWEINLNGDNKEGFNGLYVDSFVDDNGKTINGKLQLRIELLQSRVEINWYIGSKAEANKIPFGDENNLEIKGLSISLNSDVNKGASYQNSEGTSIVMNTEDSFIVTNNGYYKVSSLWVDGAKKQEKESVDYDGTTTFEGYFLTNVYLYGVNEINHTIDVIVEECKYDVKFEYYFKVEKTGASGNVYYEYESQENVEELFAIDTVTDFPTAKSINSTTAESRTTTISFKIKFTDLGKGILIINNELPDPTPDPEIVTGNTTDGYLASSYTFNREILEGTVTLGTYDTTLKLYFDFKSVKLTVDGKYQDGIGVTTDEMLTKSATLEINYDFTEQEAYLGNRETSFDNIAIDSKYYLLGWYLKNGDVKVTGNYSDILTNDAIIADIAAEGATENNLLAQTFNYNGVKAYVGLRQVNVKYTPGEADGGEFYLKDKTTSATGSNATQNAGSVGFNENLTLSNNIFYNIGHIFTSWTAEKGSINSDQNTYYFTRADWNNVFEATTSRPAYQVWSCFADDNDTDNSNDTQKEVTLTATWEKITYEVKVDNVNTAEIKIDDGISYTTDPSKKDGKAVYTIADKNVDGQEARGYVVIGFKVENGKIKDGNEQASYTYGTENTYQLNLNAIKHIIKNEYYFTANSESTPIEITTIREEAKYRIWLASSEEEYYTYTWDEDKDTNSKYNYGGVEEKELEYKGLIYIDVVYNKPALNLTDALANQVLIVSRTGYTLKGWAIGGDEFDPSDNYGYTRDITITPVFERESKSVTSQIEFTNEVGSIGSFYLINSQDILTGDFGGSVVDGGDDITNSALILNNGEKVREYGFRISINGQLNEELNAQTKNITTLNIELFNKAGDYSVVFYIKVYDTFDSSIEYEATSSPATFEMLKNQIYFYEMELYSEYNGTTEFVSVEENGSEKSVWGSFLYRYEWNGVDRSNAAELTKIGDVSSYFESPTIDGEVTAGSGRDVKMQLKASQFKDLNGDFADLFDNVTKDGDNYYVVIEDVLTIEKAKIAIAFGSSSAYYIERVQTIVYENAKSYQFSVGKVNFTFNYSKIILNPDVLSLEDKFKLYQGQENHALDCVNFVVEGLTVEGQTAESLAANFEWIIDKTSSFTLLDPKDAVQLSYQVRYLIAQDGELQNLSERYDSESDTLEITKIVINGEEQTIPTNAQFTLNDNGTAVMTVAENKLSTLYVYVNKSMASKVSIIVKINYNSNDREQILYPLAWGESTVGGDYSLAFDNGVDAGKVQKNIAFSGLTSEILNSTILNETYVVLTDAVKVELDYNGGTNNSKTKDVIYVSFNNNFDLTNPSHSYSGLSFAGYSEDSSNKVTTTLNSNDTTFEVAKGGQTVALKAKWDFNEIIASLLSQNSIERYASENGISLGLNEIVSIETPTLFTSTSYTLSRAGIEFKNSGNNFLIKDDKGYAVPSMSGTYTLALTFVYNDGVQAAQTKSKNIEFIFNILINTINVSYNGNLTYNNTNQATSAFISFTKNGSAEGSEAISGLSTANTTTAVNHVYISGSPSLELKDAGNYEITFNIVSEYSEIYQFTGDVQSTNLTISIAKYQINLAYYNNVIAPTKVFGQTEPNPIISTITIAANGNEDVKLSFTRSDASEAIGNYPLTFNEIIDTDDKNNYVVNTDGFNANFEITTPNENLQVELLESFSYTYNGSALSGFVVSYDEEDGYILSANAGAENLSIKINIYYFTGGEKVEIPQEQKDAYAEMIKFNSNCLKNAGTYQLTVSLTVDGENAGWNGVELSGDTSITISKKTITITSVEKVFDQTTEFVKDVDNVVIDGIVGSDIVKVSGSVVLPIVGEQEIASVKIDNDDAKVNYNLEKASGLKVKIVADNSTSVGIATATTTFDYGVIQETISAVEFKNLVSVSYNTGDISDEFISVKSISIADEIYSKGGYLNAGSYTVTLTLASINYTFGQAREDDLTKEYTTTKEVTVVVEKIEIIIANSNNKITKNYDETNVVLASFLGQVNATNGYYQSTGILPGDEISIISAVYFDENVENDKEITLTFADNDDHGNYTITQSVKGDIRPFSIELEVNASTEHVELVTDGAFVRDGNSPSVIKDSFVIEYPNPESADNILSGLLLPTRVGYKAVGWKYFDGNNYIAIGSSNIIDLLKSVAEDEDNQTKTLTIYTVWEIEYYTITLTGEHIDSYTISTDNAINLQGDNQSGYKARYFSDISIAITGDRGYKIKAYLLVSGKTQSNYFADTGENSGVATLYKIGSDVTVNATLEEIIVTFKINAAIPEFTSRIDTNDIAYSFGYPQLSSKTQSDLASLQVTEGTYKFNGYKDVENNELSSKTLQAVVDALEISGKLSLETDCTVNLTALWVGENYLIEFDINGGTLSGQNNPIAAVYGEVVTGEFPTISMAGKKLAWKGSDGTTYISGTTKLQTIGTKNPYEYYETTFTANWENDDFDLTIVIGDKITIKKDGLTNVASNSVYTLTYNQDTLYITVECDQGYTYNLNQADFHGIITKSGLGYEVKDLTQDSTLTFEKVCDENTLNLTIEQIESYEVLINDVKVASSLTIKTRTESVVKIILTAKKGYEFADASVSFSGNGDKLTTISSDKNTLTFTWSNFVDDANVEIKAIASDIQITIPDVSTYLNSINLNGQSVNLVNGKFTVKTGTQVEIEGVLKYGYCNGSASTSTVNYVKAGSQTNTFGNDKNYHYYGLIEGFDEDFSISFTAQKRDYTFDILVKEGHESFGEIKSASPSTVTYEETLSFEAEKIKYDYIFESWVYINAEGKEVVLSLEKEDSLKIDDSQKDFLESVAHGQNIKLYATFKKCTLDVTFVSNNYGQFTISQEGAVIATVSNNQTIVQEIFLGQNVVLNFIANKGYEIDTVKLDGVIVNLENYGYTTENKQFTVYEDIDSPISKIEVAFKASIIKVTVQAGTLINYEEYLGTNAGGSFFISNSAGVKQEDSNYLPNGNNLIIGADYQISSYSDITLYFVAEVKTGFTISVSCNSTDAIINEFTNGNLTIYSFSLLKSDATIKAIFTAKENKVKVQFALEGQTEVVYAGMIAADTSSSLVSASPNRGSSLNISIVTSSTLKLDIYSSLAYQLLADSEGYLSYYIDYGFDKIVVGQLEVQNKYQTGYTYKSTIEIENVNADANIYIYVVPQEYNIKFAVSDIEFVELPEMVTYAQEFDLDSLSEDERNIVFQEKEGYTFDGYFTSPLGLGKKYIDKDGLVVSAWYENGYSFNGSEYKPVSGFDPNTNTFTLYAAWVYNKSDIMIEFMPPQVEEIDTGYNVLDIITNETSETVWTSQYSKWFAEVATGTSISFKALEFEGYEFINWEIIFDDGEPYYRPSVFTLSNIELGEYIIKANYNPTYTLIIENIGNGKAEGGESYLVQDGYHITGNSFDKDKQLKLEAVAEEGFVFLYWLNIKTGETYEGLPAGDGVIAYTFEEFVVTPLELKAVFQGKSINVDLNISQGGQYHNVRQVIVNDNNIANFREPFTAYVGDEIKIYVRKAQGYGFEFKGASMTQSYDETSGNYIFSYVFNVEDLEEVDESTYSIRINFIATKEKINLKFVYNVYNAVDDKEISKAGDLTFENANKERFDVFDYVTYEILYSDTARLIINLQSKYRVGYIYFKTTDYFDVTSWLNGNVLVINQDIIDAYFANDITIEVYFERIIWLMDGFRSETLAGEGTKENPFIVNSAEDFALVAYLVNYGQVMDNGNLYANAYYTLKSNIDFKGKYWEPIGTEENPFNGTFDLGDYDIKNVEHYMTYLNPKTSYGGLFRYLGENAKIIQNSQTTIIIIAVTCGTVSLAGIIFIAIYIARKKAKKKFMR